MQVRFVAVTGLDQQTCIRSKTGMVIALSSSANMKLNDGIR